MGILESLELLELIESNSSTSFKESVLREQRNNEYLKYLLESTYNPFKVYNIKKIKDPIRTMIRHQDNNFTLLKELLDSLSNRDVSGDLMRERVEDFLRGCTDFELKWYKRIIQKDLNIGIQVKTINKAIPGLIPIFQPMLAQPYKANKLPKRFILQPKIDGMRVLCHTSTGTIYSRKGKELEGFEELSNAIKELPASFLIDGEITSGDNFNSLMTQAFKKSEGKKAILNVFDIVGEGPFSKGIYSHPQWDRTRLIKEVLADFTSDCIVNVPSTHTLCSLEEAIPWYDKFIAEGFEGAMIKNTDAPYECKRSYAWQKLKPTETFDLPVIGIEPGGEDTKYEEMVGRLVCLYEGNEVRIGSGLSDLERQLWWDSPEVILGRTIEVIAQEVTDNKLGTHSLRFPRFKKIRIDK